MLQRSESARFDAGGRKMSARVNNAGRHRRKRSMGSLLNDRAENLSLFQDMQKRESNNFLHLSNEDIEASLRNEDLEPEVFSEKASSDLLMADPDKNDYDWLLTPPGTPLFPSLDQEVPVVDFTERGSDRTLSPHISKFLGSQRLLSTKVSRRYSNVKESNLFSLAKNESSSMKVTPSKTVPRASSQPSTPTGTSYMQNAARLLLPNTHHTVSASFGPCLNGKVSSSSARCSSTARGISPSKRLPTTYQASQLSFFSVTPSNLRTSISDRTNSCRSLSAHSRHTRNNSVGRVSSHSTWMDSSSYLRRSTVSASPSINCSSSTSLDHECLSPTSRKSSVISPFDEVQAMGQSSDIGVGGRRYSSFCEDDFAELSTWQIKRPVSQGNRPINFQPLMSDSPTAFSSSVSSVVQHSNGSHFASHSARSERGANDSASCHGNGPLKVMHKNTYIKHSQESSFSENEKDDILTERFDRKNHKENLDISSAFKHIGLSATEHSSKRDLILHKDRDPPANDIMPVQSINQEYGLYLADKSYVDSFHELGGREADKVYANGNISPSNVFQRAQRSLMSSAMNEYVQKLQCSSELEEQRQSVSRESKLDIVEDGFNFGDNFPGHATGIALNEEVHSSLTGNEVAKVLKSLKGKTDERFVDYDLDTLQLPGLSTVSSVDSSPYSMKIKEGIDHSCKCLKVEKDGFDFSGSRIIVKSEVCFTEEKVPVLNVENSTNSDTLHLTNGHFATHASQKNEVTVLDLLSVPSPTSETSNLDFYLTSNHPSKLNICEEDKAFNTTTGSVNEDRDEGEKYNSDMQVNESILRISTSNVLNDESSSYQSNAAVSGACTTKEFAPLSSANSDVSVPSSSLLWDKRLLETTDTILFCSSIVHDIIYKASTLAIEKEASNFTNFPAATNKDLPLFFDYSKSQNANKGRAAKSCKIQAVGAECTTRQKLVYMQQQSRIDSTLVSHPENSVSTMHIDVKQQEGPMLAVVKSNNSKELPNSYQPKCHCTIL